MPNLGSPVTGGSYAKYYSNDGQGGLHETATDTTLLATATYLLQEGMLFYVASSANNGNAPTYYQLNAGFHNPLVIGDFSIFGGGSGPDPAWAAQTTWFIDPVSGSDASDGLTIGTALKTWAEYRRRMLAVGGSHSAGKVITTILSSLLATDPLIVDWAVHTSDYPTWGALVQGVTTQVRTGSITGYISRNPAINQSNVITDSGVTSWADDVGSLNGHIVHFTSGAATGCYAWITKDLGSGSARLTTVFLASPEDVQGPETQPSVGDTYEILSFPSIPNYFYAPLIGDNWDMLFLNMGSVSYSEGYIGGSNYNEFNECAFVPPYWNGGSFDTENCCIKGAIDSNNATSGWIDGGVIDDIFSEGGEIEDASDICFVGGVIMQGCSMSVIDGGYVRADDVAVFDSPGHGIYVRDARLRSNDGMWGSGNAGSGFGVGQGAKVELIYGNQSITGTSGDVYFCGAPLTWAEVSAQSYIQSLSTSSSISPNADNAGLTYIAGAGGLQSVPDDAALLATPQRFLQEGMLFYVISSASNNGLSTYYRLLAGWHNPLVITDFFASEIPPFVNPTWATQTTWFIDPIGGSDSNDGLLITTGLKTWAELRRRMLAVGGHATSTTITILSDLPSTDVMTLDWSGGSINNYNLIQGTVTMVRAGTITGWTSRNPSGGQPSVLIDSAVTDWSPDLGLATGRAISILGNYTWGFADLGSGQLVVDTMNDFSWALGDVYQVCSFPQIQNFSLKPKGAGAWYFFNLYLNWGTAEELLSLNYPSSLIFYYCWVNCSQAWKTPTYLQFIECAVNTLYLGAHSSGVIISGVADQVGFSGLSATQDSSLLLGGGVLLDSQVNITVGNLIIGDVGFFFYFTGGSLLGANPQWAPFSASIFIIGNGNVPWLISPAAPDFIVQIGPGGNLNCGPDLPVAVGAVAAVQFLTTNFLWSDLPQFMCSEYSPNTSLTLSGGTDLIRQTQTRGTIVANETTPVSVSYPTITANNVVIFPMNTPSGNTLPPYPTITPGTGFTLTSYVGDVSTYNWVVL